MGVFSKKMLALITNAQAKRALVGCNTPVASFPWLFTTSRSAMAQHHDSELVLENAAAVEEHLKTLLLRFAEAIEKPHNFKRSNFDVSNFHATSTSTNHPLENILSMLERYNQKERSILEIVYDHLNRQGVGVGVAAEDRDSDTEQEDGDESDAPSNDPSNQKWTFNNTFLLMDLCLELMKSSELSPMPQTERRDKKKIAVLKYSIELWFLSKVGQCKSVEVRKALTKTTNETFRKYISADFGQEDMCRLTILREEDCTDLVRILLKTGDFGTQLKMHLEDSRNFKEFNETPMSGSMINMLSPHSSKRYIIPRNGDKTSAYGFYVTGVFLGYSAEGRLEESSEYREIKEGYKRSGLYSTHFDELLKNLPLPTELEVGWDAKTLRTEIERCLKKIEEIPPTCSLLFLALSFHGFHEHVKAANGTEQEIRGLLKLLQKKLEGIPKVNK